MIKVNLLREQTARAHRKGVTPSVARTGLLLLLILVLLGAGLGLWWFSVSREIASLTDTKEKLRIENNRLQALKKEIADFEKMKSTRESRIRVIEGLKEAQTGPVQLLNHVLHSMPRGSTMRLTLLDQKGDRIQIIGYALRSDSIPDFMSTLASGGIFKTVDLELVQEEKDESKFSLVCISARKSPTE